MRSYKKCKDANQKEDTSVEYEEVGKKRKMVKKYDISIIVIIIIFYTQHKLIFELHIYILYISYISWEQLNKKMNSIH